MGPFRTKNSVDLLKKSFYIFMSVIPPNNLDMYQAACQETKVHENNLFVI
jgi:hypothetical protein